MGVSNRTSSCLSSREKILNAARQLFAEKGFGETSVDEIAEKAGVAKGTIYTHFASKDEILITILRIGTMDLTNKIHSIMKQQKSFLDRLKDVTVVFLEYIDHHHHFHRLYSVQKEMLPAPISQADDVRRELFLQFKNFLDVMSLYMEEGIKSGCIRKVPPEEAAFFFPTIVSSAAYYNQFSAKQKPLSELAEDVFVLYLQGFGNPTYQAS